MNSFVEFYGEKEHKLLTDPPNPNTLADAQQYISNFIEDGEADECNDVSTLTEEENRKRRDRIANRMAHFLFSVEQSLETLPGYATLDWEHIESIDHLSKSIDEYIEDSERSQPINFMLMASPGEGKSHFINCIGEKLKEKLEPVAFNMATMRDTDDFVSALERARNVTVKGKIPLLFLDEFDTKDANYGLLLPLLWDGQIELGASRLKIGRAVIVLAGSSPILEDVIKKAVKQIEPESLKQFPPKSIDLVSRINGGVIRIPKLDGGTREVDKVCITIAKLRRKFGPELKWVPASLLHFIYTTHFKYGVRSLQHFIELIGNTRPRNNGDSDKVVEDLVLETTVELKKRGNNGERDKVVDSNGVLDIGSLAQIFSEVKRIKQAGLVYHIKNGDNPNEIKKDWDASLKYHPYKIPIWCEVFKVAGRPTSWVPYRAGALSAHMVEELRGSSVDELLRDFSTWSGIEPYHITKLWLSEGIGEWNHGNEDMRHVFFNLRTLHQLLSLFINKKPAFIKDVGHRMGIGFGTDLVRFLPLKNERLESINKVIENWCRFDVSGGWGKWDPHPGANEHTGELHVLNNFLADRVPVPPNRQGKSRFCPMMEGYIQGVLEEIVKASCQVYDFNVTVKELVCGISDPKNKACKFEYEIKNMDGSPFSGAVVSRTN